MHVCKDTSVVARRSLPGPGDYRIREADRDRSLVSGQVEKQLFYTWRSNGAQSLGCRDMWSVLDKGRERIRGPLWAKCSACVLAHSRCSVTTIYTVSNLQVLSSSRLVKAFLFAMEAMRNTVWAWWVACLPGMHRALDWAWWQMPVILAPRWWVWGDQRSRLSLATQRV